MIYDEVFHRSRHIFQDQYSSVRIDLQTAMIKITALQDSMLVNIVNVWIACYL